MKVAELYERNFFINKYGEVFDENLNSWNEDARIEVENTEEFNDVLFERGFDEESFEFYKDNIESFNEVKR